MLMAAATIIGPQVLPYGYDEQDFNLIGSPGEMTRSHWLGSDELGRDALTRLVYGGRVSLAVGLAGALIATSLGTIVGALAGFYRGLIDPLLMRFTDVMLSIPPLPLVLLLSGLLRPSVPLLIAIIGALIWMGTARLVRSQFLALREREFVEAARALGAGGPRLILRHILPNAVGPITVSANSGRRQFHPAGERAFLPRLRRPAAGADLGQSAEYREPLARPGALARDRAGPVHLRHRPGNQFRWRWPARCD